MTNEEAINFAHKIKRIVASDDKVYLRDVGKWYCQATCGNEPKECKAICDYFLSIDNIPRGDEE